MRLQPRARLSEQRADDVEAVTTTVERHAWLLLELRRQRIAVRARLVGRVAQDHVILHRRHRVEHVAPVQRHAFAEAVRLDVDRRHFERGRREIDGVHRRLRKMLRQQNREATRARTDIDDPGDFLRIGQPPVELLGDDFQKIRARDDHAFIHVKTMFAQPRLAREIRRRHVLDQPSPKHRRHRRVLSRREFFLQHAFIAVERQLERAQEQIERFIMGARRHLPQRRPGLRVKLLRAAQPVAQGHPTGRTGQQIAGLHPATS